MDNAFGFTIDVFGPVPLRGNDMSLFRDLNINQRMSEFGEYKIFGDSAYRGGNHYFKKVSKNVPLNVTIS